MTLALPSPVRSRSGPGLFDDGGRMQRLALAALPHVLFVLAAVATTSTVGFRSVIAVGLALGAVSMAAIAPGQLLVTLMVWLPVLGLLRRVLSWTTGSVGADPLLLVAPVALGALAVVAIERGALRDRTPLANGVLALCVLSVLSVANPSQGGPLAGLGGLLFFLVPMLAFWVGRAVVDDRLVHQISVIIATIAVAAAVLGLYQVYSGFLPWDEDWIRTGGYGALRVGDRIRPFASFASSAEYAKYCGAGLLVWWVHRKRGAHGLGVVAISTFLAVAVFLQGSRGTVVVLLASLGVVAAVRARLRAVPALLIAAALLFGLQMVARSHGDRAVTSSGEAAGALVSRQVDGLSQPLDPNTSTLLVHVDMVRDGLSEAFRTPIGHGVGAVTIAGDRFGNGTGSTEADPSNAAVALGLPGLLTYVFVVVVGLRAVFGVARARGDRLGLIAVALVVFMLPQWLNGGMYAVAPLPWLLLGWTDRQRRRADVQTSPFDEQTGLRAPA